MPANASMSGSWRPEQGLKVTLATGQVVEIKITPGSQTAHAKKHQCPDMGTFQGQQLLQWSNDSAVTTGMLRADLTCEVDGVIEKLPSGTLLSCTLEGTGLRRARRQTEGVKFSKVEREGELFTFDAEIVGGANAFRNYTEHLAAQGNYKTVKGKGSSGTAAKGKVKVETAWGAGNNEKMFCDGMLRDGRGTIKYRCKAVSSRVDFSYLQLNMSFTFPDGQQATVRRSCALPLQPLPSTTNRKLRCGWRPSSCRRAWPGRSRPRGAVLMWSGSGGCVLMWPGSAVWARAACAAPLQTPPAARLC
jgi:hypothetical protein